MKVGVIDYGVGNIASVMGALAATGNHACLVDRALDLHAVDCFILPGVGHFGTCAELLKKGGWMDEIKEEVVNKTKPILGICLGMQMLADGSEEDLGSNQLSRGLSFIEGKVYHLKTIGCQKRLPHVGWNSITKQGHSVSLLKDIPDETDFYFVHSYAFLPANPKHIIANCNYDISFTAAVQKNNIWGTQFHPEKSSRAGLRLLKNFLEGPKC